MCGQSLQSCPTLCILMYCSPPGASVCGIHQGKILEWVAMTSSRGSSWPRIQHGLLWLLHHRQFLTVSPWTIFCSYWKVFFFSFPLCGYFGLPQCIFIMTNYHECNSLCTFFLKVSVKNWSNSCWVISALLFLSCACFVCAKCSFFHIWHIWNQSNTSVIQLTTYMYNILYIYM